MSTWLGSLPILSAKFYYGTLPITKIFIGEVLILSPLGGAATQLYFSADAITFGIEGLTF